MNKIIYLDAAASALKPEAVIEAEVDFLRNKYANAGRGICARAAAVDEMVSAARAAVAEFMGARAAQIVFTAGATDGLNRVARMAGAGRGVCVAVSDLDHHSARMPMAASGADIVTIGLDENHDYDLSRVPECDIIVIIAMSNVFGRPQNVAAVVAAAREKNPNVIAVVDAAQYAAHMRMDAAAWDADFVCFSGHKIGADTGLGIMYVKEPLRWTLDKFGGGMVNKITDAEWIFNDAPERFEAGTLPLTQIAGLRPALDSWRPDAGAGVMRALYDALAKNPRIKIYTTPGASVLTFSVDGMHALDFGALCGARGLCLRVGNMCATWAMRLINAPAGGVARLSAGAWNTADEAASAAYIINGIVK